MPLKSKAAVAFGPRQPLRVREIDVADPAPRDVVIRLAATGLCHSDLHMIEGKISHKFPAVLGHEGFGTIIACGDDVTDFKNGDVVIPFVVPECGECVYCKSGRTNNCMQMATRRTTRAPVYFLDGQPIAALMALGTFSEIIVVPDDMVVRVNPAADAEHACCIGCGVTTGLGAALITAEVSPGSRVAVFGLGGVGLSVVQGARIAGALQIVAIDRNPAREAVARSLGATDFIDASREDDLPAAVMRMTGLGADFAFECVGLPDLMRAALESTNPAWGMAVNVGIVEAGKELHAAPSTLLAGRRWTGSLMGGAKRSDVAKFVDFYVDGTLNMDALVSHRLSLEDINLGFEMMRSGESVRSVVVFDRS